MSGLTIGGVTLLWLGDLSLNAGFRDIFWPQFLQGAGMALLVVRSKRGEPGSLRVRALSDGLRAGETVVRVE